MVTIDKINRIIKKKDQKRTKIVTFSREALSKFLENKNRQSPSLYYILILQTKEKQKKGFKPLS